jgi:hypothetical protein
VSGVLASKEKNFSFFLAFFPLFIDAVLGYRVKVKDPDF